GGVAARFPYTPMSCAAPPEGEFAPPPGTYAPNRRHVVRPGSTYRLEIDVGPRFGEGGALVTAETTVPDTFRVVEAPPDTVRYDVLAPPPTTVVTPSETRGRPTVYLFTIEALEPDVYGLTPAIAQLVEETDSDPDDLVRSASPLLNEGNYTTNPDGTLNLQVPWFAIAYYGPNRLTANAVDDALYDFLRTRESQATPTTLSPGEIQRVLSNVENGTGVFGSLASVSTRTFIAP
ncbi:MAG: DUF4249 family protein, partial [Rhodothermales bacterium]|nr:DUF4249 family protein [Rhodothermales bacterium]